MSNRTRGWTLGLGLICGMAGGVAAPGSDSPEHRFAVRQLEARLRQQETASRRFEAFHGFRFMDARERSGIRFEHRIVDDAGRNYQAAHYDHGNGMAVADVDGDGLPDLYFTTQLGSNELWRNLGGGRFENITDRAGVGMADQISVGCAFADMDNDGDPDLLVTSVRYGNRLFENLGDGRFRDVTRESGLQHFGHSSGIVFFDFDNDGRLDVLVTNVGRYTANRRGRGGYFLALPDAFQGHLFPERTEFSILYRGMGGGRFSDVSASMGFRDGSWSGDATFTDLNEDGFPDLYLVNMQGDDRYYENQAGKAFVERTARHFPKTPWGAMGVKFLDFDGDGRMDGYVVDMHSDMSQPQTELALRFRWEVEKSKSEAWCSVQWPEEYYQGSTNNIFGNAFYRNRGGGRFDEVSDALGVETYWPWGVSVGDLNADGHDDIVVTAGMGYPFRYAINSVLLNDGGRRFFDAEFLVGVEPRADGRTEKVWFTLDCGGEDRGHSLCAGHEGMTNILGTLSSRSSAILDLDGDGDLDLVFHEFNDRPQILLSDLSEKRDIRYLAIRLQGVRSNRDGLGATVRVTSGGRTRTQYHDGKSGYLGQSSMPLYFGLGDAEAVEAVEVWWPSGRRQRITEGLAVNRTLSVVEEGTVP